MGHRFIMTAFGKDRPGIVADVTEMLYENGCNLEDTSMTLLAGEFTLILLFTAVISLILGMGLPTTANYIVVSTLMAPVIVSLGAQNGLIVPLIAVHLFVFYFGILADDTPPVGLAAFAAAGISGGDPIRTGIQGRGRVDAHVVRLRRHSMRPVTIMTTTISTP